MEELRTILIMDDNVDEAMRLAGKLMSARCFVLPITKRPTPEELERYLEVADLVVLDWNLDGWRTDFEQEVDKQGEDIAIDFLNGILSKSGLPAVIYTEVNEASVVAQLKPFGWFKKGMYPVVLKPKGEAAEGTIEAIEAKAKNEAKEILGVMLGVLWRPQVRKAVSAAIRQVSAWDTDVLALFADGFQTDRQDMGWAARTLLNEMLAQYLPSSDKLSRLLQENLGPRLAELTVKATGGKRGKNSEDTLNVNDDVVMDFLKAEALLRYIDGSKIVDSPLDTGDILEMEPEQGVYAIVLTPECDAVRSNATKLLFGQELTHRQKWRKPDAETDVRTPLLNSFNSPSEKEAWLLSIPMNGTTKHVVFSYNWVHTVTTPRTKEDAETRYAAYEADPNHPPAYGPFDFPNPYLPWGKRVARLRGPYAEELLANYERFQLRKGVPAPPRVSKSQFVEQLITLAYPALTPRAATDEVAAALQQEPPADDHSKGVPE